jgi:cell wall-associated NlpC family hydrolase
MSQRERFVHGMLSRVGGQYCAYPNFRANCADCSTTVAQEYQKATGQTITGSSFAQQKLGTSAGPDASRWLPGDLLVYLGGGHVGVYVGDGWAVHAMNENQGVIRTRVDGAYWTSNFVDARRLSFADDAVGTAGSGKPAKPPKPVKRPKKKRRR